VKKHGTAKHGAGDLKHLPCTTLDDCFAMFTQQEEVTSVVARFV